MSTKLIPELIKKKRDGLVLDKDEIDAFVSGVVDGEVQDSQLGAMLMATFMQGMSPEETMDLTRAMKYSGEVLEWPSAWQGLVADKHSTGGVGDKVSIALAPALAACGLKVPMISGRGLGMAGGTLDKLEAIPGFCISQSSTDIVDILDKVGCCIVGQTESLVPADRIMYAHRDVTATVASVPLIAASIISKKAAENISALVMDVKYGVGAYMKDEKDARELANTLVSVSNGLGVNTTAIISNMNCPLGRAVGNALEVTESIECLQGKGPATLLEMVTVLGGYLLYDVGKVSDPKKGISQIEKVLTDGSALNKFSAMMIAQGVDAQTASELCASTHSKDSNILPQAQQKTQLQCEETGYVHGINAEACAYVSFVLGAGRTKAGQPIDHAVGLHLEVDVSSKVNQGDNWITIHHNRDLPMDYICRLQNAILIKPEPFPAEELSLVKEVITSESLTHNAQENGHQ